MSRDSDLFVSCKCGRIEISVRNGYHTHDLADAVEIGRAAGILCRGGSLLRAHWKWVVAAFVIAVAGGVGVTAYVNGKQRQMAEEALKWFNEGDRCLRIENDDLGAIAAFSRALKIKPDVRTYLFRGFAYWRLCDFKKALADVEAALALDPTNKAALKNHESIRGVWGKAARAGSAGAGESTRPTLDQPVKCRMAAYSTASDASCTRGRRC